MARGGLGVDNFDGVLVERALTRRLPTCTDDPARAAGSITVIPLTPGGRTGSPSRASGSFVVSRPTTGVLH